MRRRFIRRICIKQENKPDVNQVLGGENWHMYVGGGRTRRVCATARSVFHGPSDLAHIPRILNVQPSMKYLQCHETGSDLKMLRCIAYNCVDHNDRVAWSLTFSGLFLCASAGGPEYED